MAFLRQELAIIEDWLHNFAANQLPQKSIRNAFARLCHIKSGEPNNSVQSETRLPQFHTIYRMPWCAFDGKFGVRLDDVASYIDCRWLRERKENAASTRVI